MKKVVGPSVLLLAGAIGSGEYVLWPSIASQVGLVLFWLVILGVGTQYFLNMQIERYTLATGETAVTGFTRIRWRTANSSGRSSSSAQWPCWSS
ncbi:MAG: Nramp family divalent metal transporter [Aeromicrobium sp.]